MALFRHMEVYENKARCALSLLRRLTLYDPACVIQTRRNLLESILELILKQLRSMWEVVRDLARGHPLFDRDFLWASVRYESLQAKRLSFQHRAVSGQHNARHHVPGKDGGIVTYTLVKRLTHM